jgi:hypothetical protein
MNDEFHFEDFTDASYARIVRDAAEKYAFEAFGTSSEEPHALWRHDVDFSVHRALKLAEIEADAGVRATYFLRLRGAFYNLLEPPVLERARGIAELGHWIGLHFDPLSDDVSGSEEELAEGLAYDSGLLTEVMGHPVDSFSFHNPGTWGADEIDLDQIAGMVNVYGAEIRDRYLYVSDSNGYWSDRRLPEVIAAGTADRLHVLTHPEWWQETAMSPSERIARCIAGRAEHSRRSYEDPARTWGRAVIE